LDQIPNEISVQSVVDTESLMANGQDSLEGPGGERMNSVREDAEGAIHYLTSTSLKSAVLLERAWQVSGLPFSFEHHDLYREVAAASQCVLVEITRPEAGGLEHLLFATRTPGLSDDEYLGCIESPGVRT